MMNKIFSIVCALALCIMPFSESQEGFDRDVEIEFSQSAARAPRALREDVHPADLFYEDTGESEEEWEQGWKQVLALYAEEEAEAFAFDSDDADWDDFGWNMEAI